MSGIKNFEAASGLFREADAAIATQNQRFGLIETIEDEDFRQLAVNGLAAEQRQSFLDRQAAVSSVDYESAGKALGELDATVTGLVSEVESIASEIDKIDQTAALSMQISPAVAEEIRALADTKKQSKVAAKGQLAADIAKHDAAQKQYESLGAAWVVPQVVAAKVILEAVTEPLAPASNNEPAIETTAELKAKTSAERPESAESQISSQELDLILRSVLWSVCDYASLNSTKGVRVEEMRKEIPELAQLSQEEYNAFKARFSNLRALISEELSTRGLEGSWRTSSKTRGTRYHLDIASVNVVIVDSPTANIDQTATSGAVLPPKATAGPRTGVPSNRARSSSISEDMPAEELAKIPFVVSMLKTVEEVQALNQSETNKRTQLAHAISEELGIAISDAGLFLSKLVAAGLLFERGHRKGTRLLSTIPGHNPEATKAIQPQQPEREDEDIVIDLRDKPSVVVPETQAADEPVRRERNPELKQLVVHKAAVGYGAELSKLPVVDVEDVAREFGVKNSNGLGEAIKQMVEWIQQNPVSPGASRVKSTRGVMLDGKRLPLWRFSADRSAGLSIKPDYRFHRIVYGIQGDKIVLVDILAHDDFDRKYK